MRLKLIAVICALVLTLSALTSCGGSTNAKTKVYWDQFVVLEARLDESIPSYLYIVYDKDTQVMYYITSGDYRSGITPIYKADGTIKVYPEDYQKGI